ncbi:pyridoxal phosphate-dependent aminotransferase [Silvibacterium acidisoli]|uniref:pyridoxal phosphate-dependent aminotransferase n=1 Tax=Acidobacteriaceae bacterium ZG23-2 TaxID=2883246 RepID=UPI00406C7D55
MQPRFSDRTCWDTTETELARELADRRLQRQPIIDLTASNPTHCGFNYDEAALLAALQHPDSLQYDPDPRGIRSAREAVARYYAERRADVSADQLLLTTSTSEAYSFLFRLLCNAGDEVLIAQPSYPLFDFLAQLEDVRLVPYHLFYDHGWQTDIASLREQITPRTRAIAVVHPNNPTGHFTSDAERHELEQICAEHGLALIVDEVFLDYPMPGHSGSSFATGDHPALTFVLSGLSKIAALPQMKAAWIAGFGPGLEEAMARLEIVADTFLSMNAPIQNALPAWLANCGDLQRQIRDRVAGNLGILDQTLARQEMVSRLDVEAGWYAVLRVPALQHGEDLASRLLRDEGVSIHPGYFFGFPGDGWVVCSLLAEPTDLAPGIAAICRVFSAV